jgi:hypothetical protein
MGFIDGRYQKMYADIKKEALQKGFSEEDLRRHYLDKLSKQTKSPRIMRMITLAYYLGWLRGIRFCDEMLNTKITLR